MDKAIGILNIFLENMKKVEKAICADILQKLEELDK